MKVCIVGAGALGSTIGGTLAAGGIDVWLIARNQPHVDAINQFGLRILEGDAERIVKPNASTSADGIGPVDLVIILVKSFHTREAVQGASGIIGPDTAVISLQNGLGHEDIIAEVVGRVRVLAGKTYVGGVFLGPGRVRSGVAGKQTVIGELDGSSTDRVRRIAAAMNAAGLLTEISRNIIGTLWDKLLINVATGAMTAITRLTYGGLYSLPVLEDCGLAAIAEAMAVARASGVELSIRAVSSLECGLLPMTQTAMRFAKIGYHDYEGVVLDLAMQDKLVRDLADFPALILRNHGLLTVGRTIGEVFNWMHRLELSCKAQLAAQATGQKTIQVPQKVVEETWNNYQPGTRRPYGVMEWPALLRKLDRIDPSYHD